MKPRYDHPDIKFFYDMKRNIHEFLEFYVDVSQFGWKHFASLR